MRTDGQLLGDFAATGSEEAFRQVVERHGPMVLAACRRLAPGAAEDAAQAVFILLARKARSLAGQTDAGAWLHRAAGFVASRAAREEARRRGREREAAAMRQTHQAGAGSPAAEGARRELAAHLDTAVGELSTGCRQAVVLVYLEGLSQAEAAERLGLPLGTVADRCARGIDKLRGRLSRRGAGLSSALLTAALAERSAAAAAEFAGSGILPSILAASKLAAVGAGAGAAGGIAVSLAEGAGKAMFWIKIKIAAAVVCAVLVAGGGGAAVVIAAAAAEPPKAAPAEGEKPAPADAGKVAWGQAAEGLQAGIIPLSEAAAKGWPQPFLCAKCLVLNRMLVRSKCEDCGAQCNSNRKLRLCESCAAKKRVCQACLAAKPAGATFAEGEPMAFEVHLRNTGEAPKDVTGAGRVFEQALVFTPVRGGTPRCPRFVGARPMGGGGMAPQQLDKGREAAWVVSVGGPDWQFEDASPAPRDATAKPIPALPTGKYAVKATHSGAKVTTGAVEIEIRAKAAAAGGEWQKLFADEGWYKGQAGDEKVFTGTLEGVPAGGPSTLQRNSYYKLGDRTIYTGAKKLPALDALVGKKVEIRGKPVDMALEGREISEIWPAEARAAK